MIILIAIIGALTGLQMVKLTRPPATVTATLQEATYATITESVTTTQFTESNLVVNCISLNLGGRYTPGLVSSPDYFDIAFFPQPPGPGSLIIQLSGLNRAVTATVEYGADQSMTRLTGPTFTIPAVPYNTQYTQTVPVPLPQGSDYVEFVLNPPPEGAGVVCLTLTWVSG